MEGSCAVIHEESRTTVRKVLRKGYKGLSAREQADIQRRARGVIEEHGLTSLTVPRVLVIEERSYVMERIDDSKPLYDYTLTPKQLTELKVFLSVMEGPKVAGGLLPSCSPKVAGLLQTPCSPKVAGVLQQATCSPKVADGLQQATCSKGFVMNDIECYIQPDGRIAIIDFDKCECVDKKGFVRRKANAFLHCI